jgi:hypothetical protein
MKENQLYVAAPPGEVYWRHEVCPHKGAEVLLRNVGGVCTKGQWYGALGQYFIAWSPMPKDGAPPPVLNIHNAKLLDRLRFAFNLVFNPARQRI